MFERSLVESTVRHASAGERWTALASITVQVGLAAVVIAVPLLHPERLAIGVEAPRVVLPPVKLTEPPPVKVVTKTAAAEVASFAPVQSIAAQAFKGIPTIIKMGDPALGPANVSMATGVPDGLGVGLDGSGSAVRTVVRQEPKTVRLSSGVMAGRLIRPIEPVYPVIAKAAGIQGTVVVEAVISKGGTIESLRVVSGPEMLRRAAIDAIQSARYLPYQLNGEPTEVQTTITVNFRMNG